MKVPASMNIHFTIFAWLAVLHIAVVSISIAQQDTTIHKPARITLADESELIGTIVQRDSTSLIFKTVGNITITIPNNQIRTIEYLSGKIIGGKYVASDPNRTRLLFAPTARPVEAGQGYFSVSQIFFPMLAVGIENVVTLAGGISLFPVASNQLVYFAPKVTPLNREDLTVGAGLFYLKSTDSGTDGLGFYYGVGTYGREDRAITVGLGWGFSGTDVSDKPVFLLGGEQSLSNSIKLITENWIVPDSEVDLLSLGIRFFGEKLAADIGLIYPSGSRITGFPFFPWVGFVYNFGTDE
jgi:hypothetical protein